MNKFKRLPGFVIALCITASCQTGKAPMPSSQSEEQHQPLPPRHIAEYDCSVPPARIDIEKAIAGSVPVNLSKVASTIQYFLVGDDKYPITDVIPTGEGFIALNQPKLYYYRQGMKRKRIGLKTEYNDWNTGNGQKLYFDKKSKQLYTIWTQINDNGYRDHFMTTLPELDSVLARIHYLYPDSLPVHKSAPLLAQYGLELFSPELYTKYTRQGLDKGIQTFNLSNDTICTFNAGIDSLGVIPQFFTQAPVYTTTYWYEQQITFRISFCDTIYRVTDEKTYKPVYTIHLGKHRLSATALFNEEELKNKAWPTDLKENKEGVFLKIYKEGKTSKSGWLDEKREPDMPSVEHQVVYLKSSKQTLALPAQNKGLTNDLDGGMAFWPDGQTEGYLYMIRPAKDFKAAIKLNGSSKQKELKAFLEGIDEKQNVMIIVK